MGDNLFSNYSKKKQKRRFFNDLMPTISGISLPQVTEMLRRQHDLAVWNVRHYSKLCGVME